MMELERLYAGWSDRWFVRNALSSPRWLLMFFCGRLNVARGYWRLRGEQLLCPADGAAGAEAAQASARLRADGLYDELHLPKDALREFLNFARAHPCYVYARRGWGASPTSAGRRGASPHVLRREPGRDAHRPCQDWLCGGRLLLSRGRSTAPPGLLRNCV